MDVNADECCYCCVKWVDPSDPQDATSQAKMSSPPRCALGNQPSTHIGQNIGGGMWMDCGFNDAGDPCGGPLGECGECAITLANDLTGPITYKPWIDFTNYYSNDCLVKPSGQNCCYCCVPLGAKKSNALVQTSNIPCHVWNNQLVANFGYQWKNCGVDIDGVDCTGPQDAVKCIKCCKDSSGYIKQLSLNHPTCMCDEDETEVNCHSNDPCKAMPINTCCTHCSSGAALNFNHDCYLFCQQWGHCCTGGPDDPHDDDGPVGLIEAPCIQTESCARGYQWSWSKCKCVVSRINLNER